MIARKFMQWAATAASAERAEGAGSLARAYLYGELAPQDRREAEVALTTLLDDPAPSVRKALAEAFASAQDAPIAIVVALANDQSDVASAILSRSPCSATANSSTAPRSATPLRRRRSRLVAVGLGRGRGCDRGGRRARSPDRAGRESGRRNP